MECVVLDPAVVMAVDARNKNTVDVIFCSPGSLFVMAVDSSNRK